MTAAYLGTAGYVLNSVHIGHVVQDGLDTGDVLVAPPLIMAMISLVLATACLHRFESLAPRPRN